MVYALLGACPAVPANDKVQDPLTFFRFPVSDPSPGSSRSAALSDIILASARNVHAVLDGRSLSDSLADTPATLRAPAQAVSFHVMRQLGRARAFRSELVKRTPPNPLFDALLLTALALLDAAVHFQHEAAADAPERRYTPIYAPHTVVDQAVTAADGQRQLKPYKALLNGVLRTFLRERPGLLERIQNQPEAVYNHPHWWVKRLRRAYPAQWQSLLLAANIPGPMVLRVNRRRAQVGDVMRALTAAGIGVADAGHDALVLTQPKPVHDIPGFEEGWWSVQDLAAQQAARLLPLQSGMRVLDACAAPGGKTAHMLERADVIMTALDADAQRLEKVSLTLTRLGLDAQGRVDVRCADAADLSSWWDGTPFDAVLADVPCTASGVVRRHPDIRWLRREADIARTVALQRTIASALWHTVKVGGHMLYATCSIFPEEGERQASWFVQHHSDAVRLSAPGQLLPLNDGTGVTHDGFFYALFAKQA
ncbi:16S rRNA (cytosine(967)-C(5))-methyltransferase RsmB [Pusillimonas sp. ANT_WB101]|nr:16S rRNA (cytosine(967)-C(5))-methyltransferase RsmB [Pusillimonas sp. ANT_WB101]